MVILVASLYAISQLPRHIATLATRYLSEAFYRRWELYVWLACQMLSWSATCYNPFVYAWMNRGFRRGLYDLLIVRPLAACTSCTLGTILCQCGSVCCCCCHGATERNISGGVDASSGHPVATIAATRSSSSTPSPSSTSSSTSSPMPPPTSSLCPRCSSLSASTINRPANTIRLCCFFRCPTARTRTETYMLPNDHPEVANTTSLTRMCLGCREQPHGCQGSDDSHKKTHHERINHNSHQQNDYLHHHHCHHNTSDDDDNCTGDNGNHPQGDPRHQDKLNTPLLAPGLYRECLQLEPDYHQQGSAQSPSPSDPSSSTCRIQPQGWPSQRGRIAPTDGVFLDTLRACNHKYPFSGKIPAKLSAKSISLGRVDPKSLNKSALRMSCPKISDSPSEFCRMRLLVMPCTVHIELGASLQVAAGVASQTSKYAEAKRADLRRYERCAYVSGS
ncbi:unnamed protein product [Protopolystoma xenopodis]|uniref:G-protein coupled receptors family 1 profile domain-containing protein n=1 Tax=Protopolystoma xenopodis TaxID=117903 RepID=A0A3S5CN38_9PLAT|nr:unnamed protein product [Protopolystoma xenopodis]